VKQIDNRQNKLTQIKARMKQFPKDRHLPSEKPHTDGAEQTHVRKGRTVLGLVSNLLVASKIAVAAKHCHLSVHNSDKSQPLLDHAAEKPPILIILDWETCEAEAFKVLKGLSENADLKSVPTVGFLSQSKADLKDVAQKAGCHRVYTKKEFTQNLEDLMMRYAL